ncbi:MAG: CDP-glycerol glycerophosphotransferase family protein [Eubacterium sp.]|nr:CDP-glycerol glycerophosphotransferase family protein [Eubacterium sp.]
MVKIIKNSLRRLMLLYKRILFGIAGILIRPDEKTILFESFQGRSYACNPKGIFEAMIQEKAYEDFQYIWVFRNVEKGKALLPKGKYKVVRFESFAYYKALARAKYWVLNSNPRGFVKPGKRQVFVQTWHGTPLKKIGCDVEREGNAVTKVSEILELYHREAKKISYMVSPSAYCTEKLISAFDLKACGKESVVLEIGYPRNDSLFHCTPERVKAIKNAMNLPLDKKVLLYAPTFRDNKHSEMGGFSVEQGIDFDLLKEQIGEDFIVLFRAHYFIAKRLDFQKYAGFVYDVSDVNDINDLYLVSDLLITDYSSVFFDYANLRRPMFFLMYDYEEYKNQVRDMYFDTKELPGPIVKNQEELVEAIRTYNPMDWQEKYNLFHDKYNYLDGPDCGKKAARQIIGY